MKFKKFAASAAAATMAMAMATPSFAQAEDDLRNIFFDCGLGGILAPDDNTIAAIINILISSPTATTQYLVAPESCAGGTGRAAAFVSMAYNELMVETAVGSGAYLEALMDHEHCDAASRPMIVASMRDDLATATGSATFVDASYEEQGADYFVSFYSAVSGAGASCQGSN